MRTFAIAFLLLMTLTATAQPTLTPPAAITDPTKLESKNVADMQNFSIEKLYSTRMIGGTTWSPDGKQIAFVTNISGRNNIWLVPAGRRLAHAAHHQRSAAKLTGVVPRWHLDRLHLRS